MYKFELFIPTRLVFGCGALSRLAEIMKTFPQSVLVVVGQQHIQASDTFRHVLQMLEDEGKNVSVCEGVKSNPTEEFVVHAAHVARAKGAAVVLGIGGGSVLDSARAIALAATHEGDLWDYRVVGSKSVGAITSAVLPIVTVPTTAGSGSELSPAALLCRGHLKEVFYSPYLFPKVAIVDPELTVSLPKTLSMAMAIDAFVQGLEAFTSKAAHPFSDMFALTAMRLVVENATKILSQNDDLKARSNISLAGIASLFAINQAGVGAVHALSNPLSGRYDIHHGHALSILLEPVMKANLQAAGERYIKVAQLVSSRATTLSGNEAAVEAITSIIHFVQALGFKCSDRNVISNQEDIPYLVKEAHNPDIMTNPADLNDSAIESIYRGLSS